MTELVEEGKNGYIIARGCVSETRVGLGLRRGREREQQQQQQQSFEIWFHTDHGERMR